MAAQLRFRRDSSDGALSDETNNASLFLVRLTIARVPSIRVIKYIVGWRMERASLRVFGEEILRKEDRNKNKNGKKSRRKLCEQTGRHDKERKDL